MNAKSPVSAVFRSFAIVVALLVATRALTVYAEAPRALSEGAKVNDRRLGDLTTLNSYFPFHVPASAEEWNVRAERLRRQVRVATGLWPLPTKTPLGEVIHGRVDRDGYTVEKVYFESFPGHFVTGSLYRPKDKPKPHVGVLCPHGHWAGGRFYDHGADKVKQEIANGAERYADGGRYPIQARCVQLARMGCVVFQYDMIGYADSVQLAHRPGYRKEMSTEENWGYFSPQAELRMQNMMGLQSYNSVRALDFLTSLPDVDPERIGVTGASGGGTQTFILCAVDPRPDVAFPAVMVSTAMQGGCTCENATYLRVGTGNVELAALFAPKPLGMSGADDWTKEIATKGLPELRRLYAMLGVGKLVNAYPFVQFGHNYNYVSRAVMYDWFNEHLGLGHTGEIVEGDYRPLTKAEMSVWNDDHPRPPAGDDHERALVKWITEDSERQLAALVPHDEKSLASWRETIGGAFDVIIGRTLPPAGAIEFERTGKEDRGAYLEMPGLLRYAKYGEELPVVFLHPKKWSGEVVIWLDTLGKQGLYDTSGAPTAAVAKLLDAGASVVGVDLLYQGESLAGGKPLDAQRLVDSTRWGYAGFTFGYNHPLLSQRTHDVLSVLSFVKNHKDAPKKIHLVGLEGAAVWAAAARAQAGSLVDRLAVDTGAFRFAGVTAFESPDFLPGAVKYGDLPGLLSLSAPYETWIAGEGSEAPKLVSNVFKAARASDRVSAYDGDQQGAAAVEWLLK